MICSIIITVSRTGDNIMKKIIFLIIVYACINSVLLHSIDYEVPYDFEVNRDYFVKYAISFMEEIGIITKKDNYKYIKINSPVVAALYVSPVAGNPENRIKIVIVLFPLSEANGFAYLSALVKKNNDIEKPISCGSSLGAINKIIEDQRSSIY